MFRMAKNQQSQSVQARRDEQIIALKSNLVRERRVCQEVLVQGRARLCLFRATRAALFCLLLFHSETAKEIWKNK